LGGLLILLAVVTVRQKTNKVTKMGIGWGILAGLTISTLNLFEKILIDLISYLPYAILVMILAAVFMWAVLLFRKQSIPFTFFYKKQTLGLMVLRSLSAYGFTLALFLGAKLSVATYFSSLNVITTVIFGIILLKEKEHLKAKLIATVLAVIGLSLILLAG
jgi:drug/metabolite transporter (DMT)-like permease